MYMHQVYAGSLLHLYGSFALMAIVAQVQLGCHQGSKLGMYVAEHRLSAVWRMTQQTLHLASPHAYGL